ncbi:MAG: glycosyltransferase family 9 protein [Alphaproteobacteria bacterium]|nr:glycosyltransferase family 9 protein [Alphaproteobacteria bacterium]
MADRCRRVLVIKLGALGDIVQAMGAAAAIRVHHRDAAITFLTTRPYADLAKAAPYFDAVWIDERPGWRDPGGVLRLRQRLRQARFHRVYDFQTRARTALYFWLMRSQGRPQWSGIAPGASHPHRNPARIRMHTLDRQEDQLRHAGLAGPVPPPDLSWLATDPSRFSLVPEYVLLIPGGAPHRPQKRWPLDRYVALAQDLAAAGLAPVVVGGPEERPLGAAIAAAEPKARDLTGATGFGDIVALGRGARRVIGNDTGPMHLAVAGGAAATVLYSAVSDPALTAPRGPDVVILRRNTLAALSVAEVAATLRLQSARG